MRAELFHEDGQTDMTKLTVAFRNSANAPKNFTHLFVLCLHIYVCVCVSCLSVRLKFTLATSQLRCSFPNTIIFQTINFYQL